MLSKKRVSAHADQSVSSWAPIVLRFFQMFIGDQAQAERLAIETLTEFEGSVATSEKDPRVALLRVALRKAATETGLPERISDPVVKALAQLEPKKRTAIVLLRGLSLDVATIGQMMGIGQIEVRSLCMSAMEQLRTLLAPSLKEWSK